MPTRTAPLTEAQQAALDHIAARAEAGDLPDADELTAAVREHGRVTLNFHPDRLLADGRSVAQSLAADGRYRGQFETGVSNGSRSAYPGGQRDQWEEQLFGGAYHRPGVPPAERPKYGALNLMRHRDGAAPRFGSCHLRLRPHVLRRCTFCLGDSHVGPRHLGTLDAFSGVLAGLLETTRSTGRMLGVPGAEPLPTLRTLSGRPPGPNGRALDDYIEAQVHGDVELARDAEALVLDPSFRGTATGLLLREAAGRCGIGLEWHAGFELPAAAVPADFRGPAIPPFAARVAAEFTADGLLNAEVLGRAALPIMQDPELQYIKQLWHVLVAYGAPASSNCSAVST